MLWPQGCSFHECSPFFILTISLKLSTSVEPWTYLRPFWGENRTIDPTNTNTSSLLRARQDRDTPICLRDTFTSFDAPSRDICGWDRILMVISAHARFFWRRELQDHARCCDMAACAKWLTGYGQYYEGIVDESQLDWVLEFHKRDTVSTFGTRSSRRVTKKLTPIKQKLTTTGGDQPESDQTVITQWRLIK